MDSTAMTTRGMGRPEAADADRTVRPGVPMAKTPENRLDTPYSDDPPRMEEDPTRERTQALEELTPVYGTAQPLRGLSGAMRKAAYRIPEHEAKHWMMLMMADRVDVLEHGVGRMIGSPFKKAGLERISREIESHPGAALVVLAAAGLAFTRALRD